MHEVSAQKRDSTRFLRKITCKRKREDLGMFFSPISIKHWQSLTNFFDCNVKGEEMRKVAFWIMALFLFLVISWSTKVKSTARRKYTLTKKKCGFKVKHLSLGICVFFFFSCNGGVETQAAADRSHMLPRRSALQRCQASLKEWSASLLCYPTIMCLTFPWQRCHSTSPPSIQLEGPCPPL